MSSAGASTDCDRFRYVTYFHAYFDINLYQSALLMLSFVIVVWGSEFLLWTFTVITQWSLLKGLSVTFHDMMGCKEGYVFMRSMVDFEEPDVRVCLPTFKLLSWF